MIEKWRTPKGEILIFKEPKDTLEVKIKTKSDFYYPGQEVEFDIIVRDDTVFGDGKVETLVGVMVTDNAVFETIGDRIGTPGFASSIFL